MSNFSINKKCFLFLLLVSSSLFANQYVSIRSAYEFRQYFKSLIKTEGVDITQENTAIFFDLDGTLINQTPEECNLTEAFWPDVISDLNKSGFVTTGLSAASGNPDVMEERVMYLKNLGIEFATADKLPLWYSTAIGAKNASEASFFFGPEVRLKNDLVELDSLTGETKEAVAKKTICCPLCLKNACIIAKSEKQSLRSSYSKGLIQTDHLWKRLALDFFFLLAEGGHPKNIIFVDNERSFCEDVIHYCMKVQAERPDLGLKYYVVFYDRKTSSPETRSQQRGFRPYKKESNQETTPQNTELTFV